MKFYVSNLKHSFKMSIFNFLYKGIKKLKIKKSGLYKILRIIKVNIIKNTLKNVKFNE